MKGKNENVVEIGVREAKSKTFGRTIAIHKKDKAMRKNTLNRLNVADLPLYIPKQIDLGFSCKARFTIVLKIILFLTALRMKLQRCYRI